MYECFLNTIQISKGIKYCFYQLIELSVDRKNVQYLSQRINNLNLTKYYLILLSSLFVNKKVQLFYYNT